MTKIQVRKGLFETNSSSVHTLVMCDESDYDKWKNGEFVFDNYFGKLIPVTDNEYVKWSKMSNIEKENRYCEDDYLTFDEFFEHYESLYETFEESYTTPNGETVIAFGYYGND